MAASSPSNRTTPPATGTARCPPGWTRSPKRAGSSTRWPRRGAKSLDARVGPRLTTLFAESGIEPLEVQPFPVSTSRLGRPDGATWQARRTSIQQQMAAVNDAGVREAGTRYLEALSRYEQETAAASAGFVELQSTLLFAVVGQRTTEPALPAVAKPKAGAR